MAHLVELNLDVVYGVREQTEQNFFHRLSGIVIRRLLWKELQAHSAQDLSPFRSCRTSNREAFGVDLGVMISLDALSMWGHSGFGTNTAQHDTRSFERSNYNLKEIICHSVDTNTGCIAVSLQKVSLFGIFTCFFGFVVLIYVSIYPLLSDQPVQGLPSLVSTIAIFSGIQLLTLGVWDEYLDRIRFPIMRKTMYFSCELNQPVPEFRSQSAASLFAVSQSDQDLR